MDIALKAASNDLGDTLFKLLGGRALTQGRLRRAEEFIAFHRNKWRLRGVDFPDVVVLPICNVNGQDFIEIVNRDLDQRGVQVVVLNLTVKYPDITAQQIAFALNHAWPGTKLATQLADVRAPRNIQTFLMN